MICLRIMGEQ